ncbi:MAG: hypothetical protein HC896_00775, partial [Bacteroidales bacterium]|nr:hypothetical protein [Bacteroidales bacterium]
MLFRKDGQVKGTIKFLHDLEKLYVLFVVNDSDLQSKFTENDEDIWLDDAVEVYIATKPGLAQHNYLTHNDYQFMVNLNNSQITIRGNRQVDLDTYGGYNRDYTWDTDFLSSVKMNGTLNQHHDVDKGYVAEMAVFWKSIGFVAHPGDTLLINFCLKDYDHLGNLYQTDLAKLGNKLATPGEWLLFVLEQGSKAQAIPTIKAYVKGRYLYLLLFVLLPVLFLIIKKKNRNAKNGTPTFFARPGTVKATSRENTIVVKDPFACSEQ